MTIHIYSSNDSGAPSLTNTAGSLATLFKTCLVGTDGTAYGAKASAGWTCPVDNTNDILLRNSATDGSGTYYRIKDDGLQESTQSTANYAVATITGAKGYNAIDELITPYPRTITGTDRHSNTFYGVPWRKANSVSSPCTWKLIADTTTCYFIVKHEATTNNAFTTTIYAGGTMYAYGFGDLGRLANVTNNPRGFVSGADFSGQHNQCLINNPNQNTGFLEHPLTGGSQSTLYMLRQSIGVISPGGMGATSYQYLYTTFPYTAVQYPSPTTGGAIFEPLFILDDTNNIVRNERHTNYQLGLFAKYRGLFACNHLLGTGIGAIGEEWDVVEYDSRQYMLMLIPQYYSSGMKVASFAIDLTGPWS